MLLRGAGLAGVYVALAPLMSALQAGICHKKADLTWTYDEKALRCTSGETRTTREERLGSYRKYMRNRNADDIWLERLDLEQDADILSERFDPSEYEEIDPFAELEKAGKIPPRSKTRDR